jgi:hypothetical protein
LQIYECIRQSLLHLRLLGVIPKADIGRPFNDLCLNA